MNEKESSCSKHYVLLQILFKTNINQIVDVVKICRFSQNYCGKIDSQNSN